MRVRQPTVVKPTCIEELQHLVRLCRSSNTPLIARGGGMSYTSGYLAEEEGGLLLDMTSMNKIVALDIENAFVTVEAGMTWSALFEALTPHGLRTPFGAHCQGASPPSAAACHKTRCSGVAAITVQPAIQFESRRSYRDWRLH